MLTIRAAQMRALAAASEADTQERALQHLLNCAPEVCESTSEANLRDIIAWGRVRSRGYGIEKEYDFFRYLNLMLMFGLEFDRDPRYPWAAQALDAKNMHPTAKVDLIMDRAFLFCSQSHHEKES